MKPRPAEGIARPLGITPFGKQAQQHLTGRGGLRVRGGLKKALHHEVRGRLAQLKPGLVAQRGKALGRFSQRLGGALGQRIGRGGIGQRRFLPPQLRLLAGHVGQLVARGRLDAHRVFIDDHAHVRGAHQRPILHGQHALVHPLRPGKVAGCQELLRPSKALAQIFWIGHELTAGHQAGQHQGKPNSH